MVFAKKGETVNSTDDKFMAQAYSYTHKRMYDIFVSRPYLTRGERILIIDDFLAVGQAARALINIVNQAGGKIVGLGMLIEKGYQKGGATLRREGFRVESLAIIDSMDSETQTIVFRENNPT